MNKHIELHIDLDQNIITITLLIDGSPAFDASADTTEKALLKLVMALAKEIIA